mmetsp:Transcript_16748/g.25819  ORF Transcript_16748/g.25819 Transcript_16748/m.25819 type:complete len:126 (+) Transcript_16748:177-554(+)
MYAPDPKIHLAAVKENTSSYSKSPSNRSQARSGGGKGRRHMKRKSTLIHQDNRFAATGIPGMAAPSPRNQGKGSKQQVSTLKRKLSSVKEEEDIVQRAYIENKEARKKKKEEDTKAVVSQKEIVD